MASILTNSEAAAVLRCEPTDANMLALLPSVDAFLRNASGHDWSKDDVIEPVAKAAARMLLTTWHENPGMIGSESPLSFGLHSALLQLQALARSYFEFNGLKAAGGILLSEVFEGDLVVSVIGIAGASGDQSAHFEHIISIDGYLQQINNEDLSGNVYRAKIIPIEEL